MIDVDTQRLAVLRAALDALVALPDEGGWRARLTALWTVLDPALSGDALSPQAWVASSGLPAPAWVGRAVEANARVQRGDEAAKADAELSDERIVAATAMDPEMGRSLAGRRRLARYLMRHDLSGLAPRADGTFSFDLSSGCVVVGPAWRDDHGRVRGLWATRYDDGHTTWLAVDRMVAEDLDVDGHVVPFASPVEPR